MTSLHFLCIVRYVDSGARHDAQADGLRHVRGRRARQARDARERASMARSRSLSPVDCASSDALDAAVVAHPDAHADRVRTARAHRLSSCSACRNSSLTQARVPGERGCCRCRRRSRPPLRPTRPKPSPPAVPSASRPSCSPGGGSFDGAWLGFRLGLRHVDLSSGGGGGGGVSGGGGGGRIIVLPAPPSWLRRAASAEQAAHHDR